MIIYGLNCATLVFLLFCPPKRKSCLGWSLLKQGKNEEALKVLDEAIKRGNDGKYPLYNKARALKRLGRFSEAIEVWHKTSSRRNLSKWVQEQISRLQKMIEQQKSKQLPEISISDDEDEEGVVSSSPGEESLIKSPSKIVSIQTSTQSEQLLEEMIERRIQKGNEVFGRKLQMYISPKGIYGRQYAIPGIGRIDLLVEDANTGDLIVIELKRDEGHDQVIGQISLYMSWVRENLARKNQKVIGVICVLSASDKLRLAAKNIPNLEVFEYNLTFRQM